MSGNGTQPVAFDTLPPSVLTAWEQKKALLEAEKAKWLTVEEAAYVLATSKGVIFRMIDRKALPVRREGKVIRIHVDDLRPRTGEAQS